MKTQEELTREASEITLRIRRLLLNKNVFNEDLSEKIAVVNKIAHLREQFVAIQKEIRLRFY